MKNKLIVMNLSAACFLFSITTASGQKTDFSGLWVIKDQQSISGNLYSNGVPKQMKATQKGDAITVEKITAGTNGDVTTTETLRFDGKPFETVTASKRRKTMNITWDASQKSFTETSNVYSLTDTSKADHKDTDTWSMEGGNLVITRKDENFVNGEVWEEKAIYEKQ